MRQRTCASAHPLAARTGLAGDFRGARADRTPCRSGSDEADGPRSAAREGNHIPEFAGGVSAIARGEPAEDGVSGFGRARIENTTGGDEGLLRSSAFWLAGELNGEATRYSSGIEAQLRPPGSAGVNVLELHRTGKRKAGIAVPGQ